MRTFKPLRTLFAFAVAAVLATFFAPRVSAQRLDDAWFKLRLAAKGHTLDTNDVIARLNFSQPVYLHFAATNDAPHHYRVQIWTMTDAGWTNTDTRLLTLDGPADNFISDFALRLDSTGGNFVHIYHTVFINSRTNHTGALAGATYDGTGEVDSGKISGKDYFGGCSVKGTRVDSSKLPFTP